jgi:transcriptional regulator with XRE-family HTH domain
MNGSTTTNPRASPAREALRVNLIVGRARARLSQQAFAERAGISRPTVSRIERGIADDVGLDVLERIAGALGVSVADLFVLASSDRVDDAELARRATATDEFVDADDLFAAIDEAAGRKSSEIPRYSRAGLPTDVKTAHRAAEDEPETVSEKARTAQEPASGRSSIRRRRRVACRIRDRRGSSRRAGDQSRVARPSVSKRQAPLDARFCARGPGAQPESPFEPFRAAAPEVRNIGSSATQAAIKKYARVDGVFVVAGNGVVERFVKQINPRSRADLDPSLGSRHAAAAGITLDTCALALLVTESGGDVKLFGDGRLLLAKSPR